MEFIDYLFQIPPPHMLYALIFMFGTLTVSSLSDLRRMAAQTDFAEVWWVFTGLMFLTDASLGVMGEMDLIIFTLKYAIIFIYLLIATSTRIMEISTMDASAQTALFSILNPGYIFIAILLSLMINELLKPLLKNYGENGAYPFLPTVWTVNLLLFILITLEQSEKILV